MRNSATSNNAFTMSPEGSLNHLPVDCSGLAPGDPLFGRHIKTGAQLASSLAFQQLITELITDRMMTIRHFLDRFVISNPIHYKVLLCFSKRLTCVVKTAIEGLNWPKKPRTSLIQLIEHWRNTNTIVLSGGLTTGSFGQNLASMLEQELIGSSVIHSPWAGKTALVGMAQTVKSYEDLLAIDFGATGVKRAVASHYGNRLNELKEIPTASYTDIDGKIGKHGLIEILTQTRRELDHSMPVAISIACYLDGGHPFKYASGIYYPLEADCDNLAEALNNQWLPACGFHGLALLEHDSTAAGLAFDFTHPAMMITLGTGLGSGPCPQVLE
ncbi:MAG: hypothetical protein ACI9DO_001192 [Reinekea sp.]|jgi:hypothetical protein